MLSAPDVVLSVSDYDCHMGITWPWLGPLGSSNLLLLIIWKVGITVCTLQVVLRIKEGAGENSGGPAT